MRSFKEMSPAYNPDAEPEEKTEPTSTDVQKITDFEAEVGKTVDFFIADLKSKIVNPPGGIKNSRRTAWDNLKNWWSDVWHGRYNQQNPFYQRNTKDDITRSWSESESVLPILSLHEYQMLQTASKALDEALETPGSNMKIMGVLDQWSAQLKHQIVALFKQAIGSQAKSNNKSVDFSVLGKAAATQPTDKPTDPTAPTTGPVPLPGEQPDPPLPERPKMKQPPIKDWMALSRVEKASWDEYGGGPSGERNDLTRTMRKAGVQTLPWILRKGDPRIPLLKSIKAGNAWKWTRLIDTKRVEGENGVVVDDDTDKLALAVAEAKKIHQDAKEEAKAKAAAQAQEPKTGPVELPPDLDPAAKSQDTSPVETPPEIETPEIETPPEPQAPAHRKQQNLFGDDEDEPKEDPKEAMLKNIELHVQKGHLDPEFATDLKQMVHDGDLEQAQQYLDAWTENEDYSDYMLHLPLRERTEFYRRLLKKQEWQNHQFKPNRRKVRELPVDERVQYYKNLLSSRD